MPGHAKSDAIANFACFTYFTLTIDTALSVSVASGRTAFSNGESVSRAHKPLPLGMSFHTRMPVQCGVGMPSDRRQNPYPAIHTRTFPLLCPT
jgi:hypothetical protein